MSDRKSAGDISLNGMGTGYVSLIMLFVAICLTALAALSFSAAGMNESLRDRSRDNMAAYYEADSKANRILMKVDEAAYEAAESGLFVNFEMSAAQIGEITVAQQPSGDYAVSWSCTVTDKLDLVCEVTVHKQPPDGRRYTVTKWETAPAGTASADVPLNVWDGTF